MKKLPLSISFTCLALFATLNAATEANCLEMFLHSPEIAVRRAAYLNILKNREQYIDQIKQGLGVFERTKEKRIDVLNKYIYLAAIIRSDKFIDPLVAIFKDYYDLGGECIYCCPIVFALTLYGAFAKWSPPGEMMADSSNSMVYDLRRGIRLIVEKMSKTLLREKSRISFNDPDKQKWLEGLELLPVEELIRMASPNNADFAKRTYVDQVIAGKVVDDKNLSELYWLAIEDIPSGEACLYLGWIYYAIERAEIAKSLVGIEGQNHNQGIDWDNVIRAAEIYFASPSPEKARNLCLALPKSQVSPGERGELFSKASDHLYGHLYELARQMPSDKNAVEVAFRLFNISDGGFTEELYNVVGDLADDNPTLFLEELNNNVERVEAVCCGTRINGLLAEGLTKEHNEELEKRIKTLRSVTDKNLMQIRKVCIEQITECLIRQLGSISTRAPYLSERQLNANPRFVWLPSMLRSS